MLQEENENKNIIEYGVMQRKKGKTRKYLGPHLYLWQKAVTDYICNGKGSGNVCVVKAP